MQLTEVDYNPFELAESKLVPVDHNPFEIQGGHTLTPMDSDPFAEDFMGVEGTKPIDDTTLARLSEVTGPTSGPTGFETSKEVYGEDYSPTTIGEMGTTVKDIVQPIPAMGAAQLIKGAGGILEAVGAGETGYKLAEDADLVMAQIQKEHPLEPGTWAYSLRNAGASIYAQAPSLAIGILNPALGLASFGAPAFGQAFHEQEKGGSSAPVKYSVAAAKGASEVLTEMIPFSTLFKQGIAPGKRMLTLYLSELLGEQVNTAVSGALDKVTIRPDMTTEEYIANAKETFWTTLFQTIIMGAGSSSIHHFIDKQTEVPEVGAPLAPEGEAPLPQAAPITEPVMEEAIKAEPRDEEVKKDIFDEIAPEEVPTLEELTAEVEAKVPPAVTEVEKMAPATVKDIDIKEKSLQVPEETATLKIGDVERRAKSGTYYHDTVPEEARTQAEEGAFKSARSIARGSLRTVREENAVEFSGIKNPDRKRIAAAPVREAESGALRTWATQNKLIQTDFVAKHQESGSKGGQENDVYLNAESGRWFKANRLTHTPTYSGLFDRITIHNKLFPSAAYKFEGFTETKGELLPIFSQDHIKETEKIADKKLESLAAKTLREMGFSEETDFPGMVPATRFIHPSGIVVSDINARNVAYVSGEVVFVDPVIEMDHTTKKERILDRISKKLKSESGQITIGRETRAPRPEGKAGQVYDDLMKARETSLQKKKTTIKQTYKKLKTSLVDVAGNTKAALNKLGPEGKKAVMRHIAHGGAHSKALRMADKATTEIYGKLSPAEHDYLDQYIYAKRNIEIASYKPNFKMPGGRTAEHMQAAIDAIPKDIRTKIEKRAETYWNTMDSQLQELKKEGLLSEASLKALRKVGKFYSPRVVLDYVDPMTTSFEGGKKITVPDSGLKKLSDEGSEKLIEGDSSLLLSQIINRTQSRIFKNRANQALWELAEAEPNNPMVRKAKVTGTTGAGKPIYQAAPHGWEKISVMIDGQHKEMMMPSEFAGEWIFKDPLLLHAQRNAIQWLSGTKILKSMATGLNPEFAFTNIPRDIALIWTATEQYSPVLPKALGQMGLDIGTVLKDAVTRKGAYEDYINEGGGMEFLTHQGRFTPKIHGHLGRIQNVMGYFGETSEIMTRLALRQRAIKNGATPEEATIIARNYLDFTQGGNLAKAADSALPYLNAGIQATRGIVRAAATNPKLFSVKIAQVGGLATSLYLANALLNGDAWDEIPDRDKVGNWIITTPYSYHDKDGTKRYIYFKIPKDQGQRVFSSIFEGIAAKSIGNKVDADQISMAVRDFIPFSPTNLPPTVEAFLGYTANKDFWFNEDIWRGPKVKTEEEYTRYTPKAYVKAGKALGMSPERLKNSLQQVFTYGNIWTSLVGGGTKILLDDLDKKQKDLVTEEVILKQPFVRKMVRSTDPYYKWGKDIEKLSEAASTEKYVITRDFDNKVQEYFDGDIERGKVVSHIKEQPVTERRRLVGRFKRHEKLKGIPDRKFWVELIQSPPKARAQIFLAKKKLSDAKEKEELEKMSRRVPGFRGKMFNYHLRRLEKGEK